ncbi:hypothetical protein [Streptosporangium lutulentum]|uniref:Uncharacterized protein n=1 Tax=Streptosporangium lutulentum TaxID=1461250 RepID=A0ABT9QS38_9ACTN|nr:hypothetical protein [Streptosporangium lutulentum]MDP9849554.1 hypothetical protein [Streptosporangium lutulentum]
MRIFEANEIGLSRSWRWGPGTSQPALPPSPTSQEDGPPADVRILMGRKPGIDNGLFQADLDDLARDQVKRLVPPI